LALPHTHNHRAAPLSVGDAFKKMRLASSTLAVLATMISLVAIVLAPASDKFALLVVAVASACAAGLFLHIFLDTTGKLKPLRIADASVAFAERLAAAAPGRLETTDDLRRELAASLPGPVLVQSGQLGLLISEGATLVPLEEAGSTVMVQIEQLFVRAWLCIVADGTEEVWASIADLLTGSVLAALDRLTHALAMSANRNDVDPSGTTDTALRPDYWLLVVGALLLKAEHKRTAAELEDAKAELVSKMRGWNAVALQGLPFLPCFAVGGSRLQFCAVVLQPGGIIAVEDASAVFDMYSGLDRLRIVRATCNMFRVLVALRRRMPAKVPPLYTPQMRPSGASITVMDDHVRKVVQNPASTAVYRCLMGTDAIPCAIRIIGIEKIRGTGEWHLKMTPVCAEVLPDTEVALQRSIRCVLQALAAFHTHGFVHRDVRWPNILRDPRDGGSLLIDFELAERIGKPLPAAYHGSSTLPPEARHGGPYGTAGDVWQVGLLLQTWAAPARVLSPPAAAFVKRLASNDPAQRLTAVMALQDAWLLLN